MTMSRKVLCVNEHISGCFWKDALEVNGLKSLRVCSAMEALERSRLERFDGILIEPKLSPGHNYIQDRPLAEVVTRNPWLLAYGEVGLHVITRVRTESSPNSQIPIVVYTLFNAEGDELLPDAKERVLRAGANSFFYAFEHYQKVVDDLKQRMQ